MHNYKVDPEIMAGFIDESMEGLDSLDNLFLNLEKDPGNLELVNNIFRPVHSIKGSAAFFGLMKVKTLSHHMEDVLDQIRQSKKFADPETIKLLLLGLDKLKQMLSNVREDLDEITSDQVKAFEKLLLSLSDSVKEESDVSQAAALFGDLLFAMEEIRANASSEIDPFIDNAQKIISKITPIALKEILEQKTDTQDPTSALSDILNNYPILELQTNTQLTDSIKNTLEQLLGFSASDQTKEIIEQGLSEFNAFMTGIGFDEILKESLLSKIQDLKKHGKWTKDAATAPSPVHKPQQPQSITAETKTQDAHPHKKEVHDKTMRVSEKDIDSFLSFVSELVVVEEMFNYLQKKLSQEESQIASDFKRVIETFGNLSKNLRDSIFAIRMVSVKSLLQRSQRIVHDVASETNKEANVEIYGEDTKIDKSYLELLDAPFTHIIRNAVDHGIEEPAKRENAGKDKTGTIIVSVRETDKSIELVIQDDGKGIDYQAISKKAIEMGLIEKAEHLDNEALTNFLFMSGVSTAEKISEISGRGVGMDVVKRNIEEAGGIIKVESKSGQGSTFSISLPKNVSTQIIDGFLIQSGKNIFVMPMDIIGESFAVYPKDIKTVEKKGNVIIRRGQVYKIVRLKTFIEKTPPAQKDTEIGITISIGKTPVVVSVDRIIGVQKVVVRNVEGLISQQNLFDGAALLGDGNIAMILGKKGFNKILSW